MSGFFKLPSTSRPDRAVHLNGVKFYWPPPGCLDSQETARRLGISDNNLRAMRARKAGEDRGPDWIVAPNGHSVAYLPTAVKVYIAQRAAKLRAEADAMVARAESLAPDDQAAVDSMR